MASSSDSWLCGLNCSLSHLGRWRHYQLHRRSCSHRLNSITAAHPAVENCRQAPRTVAYSQHSTRWQEPEDRSRPSTLDQAKTLAHWQSTLRRTIWACLQASAESCSLVPYSNIDFDFEFENLLYLDIDNSLWSPYEYRVSAYISIGADSPQAPGPTINAFCPDCSCVYTNIFISKFAYLFRGWINS